MDVVLTRALSLFAQVSAPAPLSIAVKEPVVPTPSDETIQDQLVGDDEVREALLEAILAKPVEEWMTFLHPSQAKLVRRSFAGPSRIRGPAGTGKTVVGLHRAAHLARTRPGRVLVTTFVKTLPAIQRNLLTVLAPDVVDKVDFLGVHSFAHRLLRERGVSFSLDPPRSREAFRAAWRALDATSGLLSMGMDERYWWEEIAYVLKGRGITSFDTYVELNRLGRRQRLPVAQRREVWQLYLAYDRELRTRGVVDYADLILLAEAELRREPLAEPYASVIVDEAQDLTCSMIRLLKGAVADDQDGFTLMGDGQQSIYPGGYTLAEAGISVSGRGVVLDVNYRNTLQIIDFARTLVDGDEFDDIEGVVQRGDLPSAVMREGSLPVVRRCPGPAETRHRMLDRITEVTREIGTGLGDVAILCSTHRAVRSAMDALTEGGIPFVPLEKYVGQSAASVKIGTIKRAKGLEFKQVLIPDVRIDFVRGAPPGDDVERESWELYRRELYVAMTRARDGLWIAG